MRLEGSAVEVQYKSRNGRLLFKIEGSGPKELFKGIAAVQEVFEIDDACGCCKSTDVVFRVRTIDNNDFYEIVCRACHAQLSYGQRKTGGGLWVKRLDEEKRALPDRGWSVYRGGA